MLVGISLRFSLAGKSQRDLALRIARASPAHHRISGACLCRCKFEQPIGCAGLTRLHGVFGALKDTCWHGRPIAAKRVGNQVRLNAFLVLRLAISFHGSSGQRCLG